MKNLLLAVLLLGLSSNVFAAKDATETGESETICKYNKDHLARVANPEVKADEKKDEKKKEAESKQKG